MRAPVRTRTVPDRQLRLVQGVIEAARRSPADVVLVLCHPEDRSILVRRVSPTGLVDLRSTWWGPSAGTAWVLDRSARMVVVDGNLADPIVECEAGPEGDR